MPLAHRLTILLAFTVSGCAGLIYESVWSHYLGLYLGHAAYAQTLTLAIFMGGMTLGAFIVSRYIERIRNALMGYALAELILAAAGLVFHAAYTGIIAFSYDSVFPSLGNANLIGIYKWTSAALLILPQSIVLGATFPLLCSALIRRAEEGIGQHISILYFSNSIGAAAGALIATFLLLPAIGMPGAMLTAGILNLAVAIVCYYVGKSPETVQQSEPGPSESVSDDITKIVLIAAAITGAVSFMYEIAWIRMLNLVLGTSLHAFEIMLSSFIAGLAFGGLWIRSRIDKISDLLRFTGQVQIFMGLAAIGTLALYVESFHWVAALLNETLLRTDTGYFFYNLVTSLISGLIMIPATFCAGMTLPLLTTHLVRARHSENAIGRVYASNTIGAIIGIVLAVHVGMTLLGLKWLIVVAGIIDIGLGVYLIFYRGRSLHWVSMPSRGIALALLAIAGISLLTELNPSRLAAGTFRYARADVKGEILFYQDGKTASISVQDSGNGVASIATNGKPDAGLAIKPGDGPNIRSDEVTMGMLGSIAYLINPEIKKVANIGFGSGLTSQFLLSVPSLELLDTIEIEPAMIEGAKLFKSRNYLAFDDERSHIRIDDAKTFFAAQQNKYDLIVSEPSNPWVIGVGNLFTHEFYQHIKRYLTDDGMLVQWLHMYEISLPTLLTALSALNDAFGSYELYAANSGDIIIVATSQADSDLTFKTKWAQLPDGLKAEFDIIGVQNLDVFKSRKLASKQHIDALIIANDASRNSDYFPLLSLHAPKDRFKSIRVQDLFNLQLLGIFDTSFRNRYLSDPGFEPDEHHPFNDSIKLARKIETLMRDETTVEDIAFDDWGALQILKQPLKFCSSEKSRVGWVLSLFRFVRLANVFASSAFREQLLAYVDALDCRDQLNPNSVALLDALVISLGNFQDSSSDLLRASLLENNDLNPEYLEFIISCYLTSLLSDVNVVKQDDLDAISQLRGQFSATNLWLEALVMKKISPES